MKKTRIFIISAWCTAVLISGYGFHAGAQDQPKQSPPANQSPQGKSAPPVQNWPEEIRTDLGRIQIYQPQPDSLIGNKLYFRSAVQVAPAGQAPVFGAIWVMTVISTDRETRLITLVNAKVLNVRFPNQDSIPKEKIANFKSLLETEIPKWDIPITLDELTATLKESAAAVKLSNNYRTDPPDIIFTTKPSLLLLFDGEPSFKPVDKSGNERAVNTPYFVVQDPKDKQYYFYGGTSWFSTANVLNGPWAAIKEPPATVKKLLHDMQSKGSGDVTQKSTDPTQQQQQQQQQQQAGTPGVVPEIIVRTQPAELLQSDGDPKFAPIQGTGLLYMTNTVDNIFMTIDKQQYFVLISGRWYVSKAMTGPWTYTAADKLPADFARIPEGSEKDVVLASVAGTEAAKDALMDAQIPQTAAVDRKTATCKVTYNGDPKFVQINGTQLYRAVNTSSTVLLYNKTYYVCDNAVWFTGSTPEGPWKVATKIPDEVQKIPPDDPSYNVKYVYIYDVEPDVVYMGYLPGYMGCYVCGPTIIYGTGFPYPGWYGPYYYPHPVTFGFSMCFNPWTGWSMGFGMSFGCFSMSFGMPMYPGGWWGPPIYHPPYVMPYNHYYGGGPVYVRNTNINVNVNNYNRNNFNQSNIYNRGNQGVKPVTQPANRQPGTQGTRPTAQPANRSNPPGQAGTRDLQPGQGGRPTGTRQGGNNVYTDRQGNVYRQDHGNWQQNDGKSWNNIEGSGAPQRPGQQTRQTTPAAGQFQGFDRQQMESQSYDRNRAMQRQTNASNFQRSAGFGGGGGRGGRR